MHEKNVELSRLRLQVDTKIKVNTGISCLVGDGRLPTTSVKPVLKQEKLWRKVFYFLVVTIMVVIMCARRMTAQYTPHGRPVHLDSLKALFFYRHRDTTYRRSSPIPQIRCLRGCEYEPGMVQHPGCILDFDRWSKRKGLPMYADFFYGPRSYISKIEMVRCLNIKGNGRQSRWRCEADLPRHLRFDETAIICEGFDSMHDDHVLEGSCGLEFSLVHEPEGRLPWLTAILPDWRIISVPLALSLLLGLGYVLYRRYYRRGSARGLRRMNRLMAPCVTMNIARVVASLMTTNGNIFAVVVYMISTSV